MNRFSLFFLSLLLTVAFFFSFQFISSLIYYKVHGIEVPVKINQWKISETRGQKFIIIAFYTYIFKKKSITAEEVFPKKFLNSEVAFDTLKDFSKRKWTAWVKKSGEGPTLNRDFPFKKMLQAGLSIGVFLYFLFFKRIYQT